MRNFWLVARYEYRRMVVRRGFVLATVAIPIGMALLIALIIVVATMGEDKRPIGFVDRSAALDLTLAATTLDDNGIEIRAFPDEDTALSALNSEEIQAFFVIPAGYPQTLETELYYLEEPPSNDAWRQFDDFVRLNLVTALPEDVQNRLLEGSNFVVKDTSSSREFSEENVINVILPFAASFFFLFATMTAAGYLLGVVASEKENRTMEIMVSSVTPNQLIGGKSFGLLGATLTQLTIYVVAAIIAVIVASAYIKELQNITVPWEYLALMALFFFPAYALLAAVMVSIGAAVTELQQGQQIAGILNLIFMLPLFLLPLLFTDPGHPALVVLTLFPPSAFMTVSLRWGLSTIPMWQIGLSWVLLVATAIFMVWVAARIFRTGMLRYGQPLTLRGALSALRESG